MVIFTAEEKLLDAFKRRKLFVASATAVPVAAPACSGNAAGPKDEKITESTVIP